MCGPAAITLGSSFLGGLGKSLGAPAGPSNAVSGAYGTSLDGSGFNVNFGTQFGSGNPTKTGIDPALAGPQVASAGYGSKAVALVLGVAVVAWWIRHRKGKR